MKEAEKSKSFTSEEFLNQLRARDHAAVTAIVRAYTEQLLRTSHGLGFDQNSAQELVQSVWVTFFDVLSKFQGRSHIRTFIFGILYNKASEIRREQRRVDSNDPIEDVLETRFDSVGHWIKPPISPEEFLIGAQTMDLISKCLNSLPLNQRMAFSLKEVEDYETPEICKILDITVTHLGVLLYRARNRLRECVEGKTVKRGT
jgi:RNA polymerase sigma-70 factor, ECF subfamily